MAVFPHGHMPSLDGATAWLNSEPLDSAELRGHVVLVNFWTLTCINWLRQEPYVRAWSQAYRGDGLIVIGVHTPEFSFEHEIERVRQATKDMAIDYPVAVDNDYAIWSAFDNHYWPALYFVDADGVIRDQQFGEGRYAESERVIQRLLDVERELVSVGGLAAASCSRRYAGLVSMADASASTRPTPVTALTHRPHVAAHGPQSTYAIRTRNTRLPGNPRVRTRQDGGGIVTGRRCRTRTRR